MFVSKWHCFYWKKSCQGKEHVNEKQKNSVKENQAMFLWEFVVFPRKQFKIISHRWVIVVFEGEVRRMLKNHNQWNIEVSDLKVK